MNKPEILRQEFERTRRLTKYEEVWKDLESRDFNLFSVDLKLDQLNREYNKSKDENFSNELLQLHTIYISYIKESSPHIYELRYTKHKLRCQLRTKTKP